MNFKKLLMSCLSAAMVVSSLTSGAYATDVVAPEQEQTGSNIVTYKSLVEVNSVLLKEHASAKNSQPEVSGIKGGPAKFAFDGDEHWWHSKADATGTPSETNPVWIQTGFGGATKQIKKVTYKGRDDNRGGIIKKYQLMVANKTDNAPVVDSDFRVVKTGEFQNNMTHQEILLDNAVPATHIRLVALSVYPKEGFGNYATARRIMVYEEVENQYDTNKEAEYWDYENAKGTLGTQTSEDIWTYQIKANGTWSNIPDNAFHEDTWMCQNSADPTYHWAKLGRSNITSTFNTQEALAFTWKAQQPGYYKAGIEAAITGDDQKKLDAKVWHVSGDQTTTDGKVILDKTLNVGDQFTTRIVKVEAGDLIRIGAVKKDAWAQNFLPYVEEVGVKAYAEQYLEDVANVENEGNYGELMKEKVRSAREELRTAIQNGQDVQQKLTALEQIVDSLSRYVPVKSITLSQDVLSLEVGATETLEATVQPTGALTDVEWSTSNESVAKVDNGTVTAVAAGTATITVKSLDNPLISTECSVTVTAKVNKGDLGLAIQEAESYKQEDYTAESWNMLKDAIVEAKKVYESQTVTQGQVEDATNTLMEVVSALKRLYKVTVNGQVVATGSYNQIVTITAPEAPEGKKFAGWELNGVVVSSNESYAFAISGNLDFTAKFINVEEEVTQNPQALLTDVIMTTVSPTKTKVSFVNQIVIPKGYTVLGAGFAYTKDASIKTLHGEDGILTDSRIKNTSTNILNTNGQFSVSWSKVTKGSNIYSETWAKLRSPKGEIVWVYSPLIHTIIK